VLLSKLPYAPFQQMLSILTNFLHKIGTVVGNQRHVWPSFGMQGCILIQNLPIPYIQNIF
jgi:hypothetical protein